MPTIPVKTLLSTYRNVEKFRPCPLLDKHQLEGVEDILRICPKLRRLSLKGGEADISDFILHYCRDLEMPESNEES
ncbi:hypothetical protein BJV82DRAFT_664108 [Fennellomyces sp. T-0311]|nr:hypothetical protein BJV82DRAFT_664108 [Fennellomyces sp. T-0311]